MRLSGADITIKLLERQGVEVIAGIPGGSNLPLYDSLYKSSIKHILTRHEQGAAFIAQGIARSTGSAAVCFATSGPGATNLLTAIADAKLDSVPIIAITGQVPSSLIGTDAFQEVDTYGLTIPITKHNFFIHSVDELFRIIPEAFKVATSGRPGPVVIDIPKDIQMEEFEFDNWPIIEAENVINEFDEQLIEQAAEMINKSEKPLLYIGGGIISSNASNILGEFARKNSIPVTTTLMALGSFPEDDSLYLGMLGMHGARYTNILFSEADLILALGVRFDDRATGNVAKFCPNAKIIHIDIDKAEIDKIKKSYLSIQGDICSILDKMITLINDDKRAHWISEVEKKKQENPFLLPNSSDCFHPINIIKNVSKLVNKDTIITTDVGQHQMWTAQVYPFKFPRTFLTSGGLGTMGFGLPAAIGAAIANPNKKIVCFSGDGSFLMNIQELATLADLDLDVKVIILNNGHLGLVRQQQEILYNEHYIASKFITNPDFSVISQGFGIESYSLEKNTNPAKLLYAALNTKGPCVINVPINSCENVLPIVPPGCGNLEMIGGE
ncbi:acetolactate synthase [Clostridium polyendosporum]|uniref:Acetolactate synthase n=1 Tax=Clostridium polyendosporum TaxID=69208 RepID=A0A919S180_9CLOT|nr:biosynthetic-type acetolactate synthase large subunit [Clostridium polyendosporum]GIM30081.1 acetolactate synthase [Clostridium polyendosporum]